MTGSTINFQKILSQTDWANYNQQVAWSVRAPECSLYDGRALCPYWREWISSGRALYPQTPAGKKEFAEDVRRKNPDISHKLIREILGRSR